MLSWAIVNGEVHKLEGQAEKLEKGLASEVNVLLKAKLRMGPKLAALLAAQDLQPYSIPQEDKEAVAA